MREVRDDEMALTPGPMMDSMKMGDDRTPARSRGGMISGPNWVDRTADFEPVLVGCCRRLTIDVSRVVSEENTTE